MATYTFGQGEFKESFMHAAATNGSPQENGSAIAFFASDDCLMVGKASYNHPAARIWRQILAKHFTFEMLLRNCLRKKRTARSERGRSLVSVWRRSKPCLKKRTLVFRRSSKIRILYLRIIEQVLGGIFHHNAPKLHDIAAGGDF